MTTEIKFRTAFQMASQVIDPSIPHTHVHYQAIKASMKDGAGLRQQVMGFHRMYDMPVRTNPVDKLADVSNEEIALRIKLNCEEFIELMSKGFGLECEVKLSNRTDPALIAEFTGFWDLKVGGEWELSEVAFDQKLLDLVQATRPHINVIEIADASGDLKYVLEGQDLCFGIPSTDVSREIHASNMTKLDENGNVIRREDGKILKGPNYMEPQLGAVIMFRKEY